MPSVRTRKAFASERTVIKIKVMSALETIVEKLRHLTPDKLALASNYVDGLREVTQEDRLAALNATGGCLTTEEADELERAIEEGCERIDLV